MQMENTAYRAIAIVGAGAILPDAPNVTGFLGEREAWPLQHQRRHARPLGPGVLLRRRSQRARTRRIPRSADGCASTRGIR